MYACMCRLSFITPSYNVTSNVLKLVHSSSVEYLLEFTARSNDTIFSHFTLLTAADWELDREGVMMIDSCSIFTSVSKFSSEIFMEVLKTILMLYEANHLKQTAHIFSVLYCYLGVLSYLSNLFVLNEQFKKRKYLFEI